MEGHEYRRRPTPEHALFNPGVRAMPIVIFFISPLPHGYGLPLKLRVTAAEYKNINMKYNLTAGREIAHFLGILRQKKVELFKIVPGPSFI